MYAIASTTADSRLPQDSICRDEAILRRDTSDSWPRVHTSQHAWMSLVGDMDGDGLFDFPNGIDALSLAHFDTTSDPTMLDLWFSTDRDFLGFQDGDILRITPMGGIEIVYSEAALLALLQQSSGTIDVDALAVLGPNTLRISLANNLTATILGDLSDGDILEWDPQAGTIQVIATEADVQLWVNHATLGNSPIGDVKSLSMLPGSTDMAFTVQAPTAQDASVFATSSGGILLDGWEESDWSFEVSTELDALCFVPASFQQPVVLSTDVPYVLAGSNVKLRMRHATPGTGLLGLAGTGFGLRSQWRGNSGLALINPMLGPSVTWPASSQPNLIADTSGSADYTAALPNLPPGATSMTLWFQTLDLSSHNWSSAIVLRLE